MSPAERHEVAVLALPKSMASRSACRTGSSAARRRTRRPRLYRVRVASLDGGPVRTSAGYSVLPEHDASILARPRPS